MTGGTLAKALLLPTASQPRQGTAAEVKGTVHIPRDGRARSSPGPSARTSRLISRLCFAALLDCTLILFKLLGESGSHAALAAALAHRARLQQFIACIAASQHGEVEAAHLQGFREVQPEWANLGSPRPSRAAQPSAAQGAEGKQGSPLPRHHRPPVRPFGRSAPPQPRVFYGRFTDTSRETAAVNAISVQFYYFRGILISAPRESRIKWRRRPGRPSLVSNPGRGQLRQGLGLGPGTKEAKRPCCLRKHNSRLGPPRPA